MSDIQIKIQNIMKNPVVFMMLVKKMVTLSLCEKFPSLWLQAEKRNISRFVKYIYGIPFYRKKFEEAGVGKSDIKRREDFLKLPLLSKEEYRSWINHTIAENSDIYTGYRINATSGSTGEPLVLYEKPFDSAGDIANLYRAILMQRKGFNLFTGKILHIITRSSDSEARSKLQKLGLFRYYKVSLADCDKMGGYSKGLDYINEVKPDIIQANKTALYVLFDYATSHNITIHRPKLILSMGEMLDDSTRSLINSLFGNDVLMDVYGSAETGNFAVEKIGSNRKYIIWRDSHAVNIVNSHAVSAASQSGEIAITAFDHRAFPVVNYCLGDSITLYKEKGRLCICGINGRCNDYLIGKSLKKYTSSYFMNVMDCVIRSEYIIKQYRIVEDKIGYLKWFMVLEPDTKQARIEIESIIRKNNSLEFEKDFDIEFVYKILLEPDANGKLRILVNNCMDGGRC